MTLTELPVQDLIAAFRSPEPTPGGGSAAALTGAVGAALLAMVSSLSRPRASTPDDVERLADASRRCTELSKELTALVDRDSDAYGAVVAAYRLPKSTPDESRPTSGAHSRSPAGSDDDPARRDASLFRRHRTSSHCGLFGQPQRIERRPVGPRAPERRFTRGSAERRD